MEGSELRTINLTFLLAGLLLFRAPSYSQQFYDPEPHDFVSRHRLLVHDFNWYKSDEAARTAGNVLLYQRNAGGWTKGKNYFRSYSQVEINKISNEKNRKDCTWDNNSTYTELFFLARMYLATSDGRYKDAFNRGIDLLLEAQYDNGGWPQYYPDFKTRWSWDNSHWNPDGLERLITFNDDAIIGLLVLLKKTSKGESEFSFVDSARKVKANAAVEKGIDCILKCQYFDNGRLTAWPTQADEITFEPKWGRTFEPPSVATMESVSIIRFLMDIDSPGESIINSVQLSVKWLDEVKILNTVIEYSDTMTVIQRYGDNVNGNQHGRRDKFVRYSKKAEPIWSRFYELHTERPVFASRNDSVSYKLSDISLERRSGYSWYGEWPRNLLEEEYPAWCKKNNLMSVLKK